MATEDGKLDDQSTTSITLTEDTRDRLRGQKQGGERYDDTINRLLDHQSAPEVQYERPRHERFLLKMADLSTVAGVISLLFSIRHGLSYYFLAASAVLLWIALIGYMPVISEHLPGPADPLPENAER